MSNPYNCPPRIYAAMDNPLGMPILAAVKKIGPDTIVWSGDGAKKGWGNTDATTFTCWRRRSDDKNLTFAELYKMAGITRPLDAWRHLR